MERILRLDNSDNKIIRVGRTEPVVVIRVDKDKGGGGGYDDVAMIRKKSEYVMQYGFGGAMIWALDLDDFNNVCGCEHNPLLRTINRVLRGYSVPDPNCSI